MDHIHYWCVCIVLEMLPHWGTGSKYVLKKRNGEKKKKSLKPFSGAFSAVCLSLLHQLCSSCPSDKDSRQSPNSMVGWRSCKALWQLWFLPPFSQKVFMSLLTSWAIGLQSEAALEDLQCAPRATFCMLQPRYCFALRKIHNKNNTSGWI